MNTVLELSGISKRFGQLLANDNISLSLQRGEILALLGENGAGKTTLMNILFGHYAPDSGTIRVNQQPLPLERTDAALKAGIGMVHQHFTLAENMTVLDNILLGTESLWLPFSKRSAAVKKLHRLIEEVSLQVDLNAQVSALSVGEKQRVEILKVLYRNATILILDEPTAVLAPQEVDNLFQMLRAMARRGIAIILITHKLHEVLAISDRVAVLRRGKLVAINQTSKFNRQTLAELIVGEAVVRPELQAMQAGEALIELTNVSVEAKGLAESLQGVSLMLKRHRILGIAGVSGNGQRTLASVLAGQLKCESGELKVRGSIVDKLAPGASKRESNIALAAVPEDRHREGVVGEMSVWENLLLDDLGDRPCWTVGMFLSRRAAKSRAKQQIEHFDIRCASMDVEANLLSGGNMQKLILARKLSQAPDVIIANQPTRGLDEGAIAFVHQQLLDARQHGAGVILISEDLDELLTITDDIAVINGGQLSQVHPTRSVNVQELGLLMTSNVAQQRVSEN